MKHILTFMGIALCFSVLSQEKTRLIIKQEGFGKNHNLYASFNNSSLNYNETGEIVYEEEILITEPTYYTVGNFKTSRYTGFWVEPGHGEVTVYKKNFVKATQVKGSKSQEIFYEIKFSKNQEAKKKSIYDNIDHVVTHFYLNQKFQFSGLTDDELQAMYDAISPEYHGRLKDLHAYLVTRGIPTVRIDSDIYDFTAENESGDTFNTKDYRGKYLLLDFAATGCGPCWTAYPDMIKEVAQYDNLQVLTFNEDDRIKVWNKIAAGQNLEIPWPVLWSGEKKKETFEIYNIVGLPTLLLVSPQGKVLDRWEGASHSQLKQSLKKFVN